MDINCEIQFYNLKNEVIYILNEKIQFKYLTPITIFTSRLYLYLNTDSHLTIMTMKEKSKYVTK